VASAAAAPFRRTLVSSGLGLQAKLIPANQFARDVATKPAASFTFCIYRPHEARSVGFP
jgi:hypothetical protein